MKARATGCVLCATLACITQNARAQRPAYEELQVLAGALNHIRSSYVDSVTYAELIPAAIRGMLASLDPHSYYVRRETGESLAAARAGESGWLGLAIQSRGETAVIAAVGPDSPADQAGIRAGDQLLAIDSLTIGGVAPDDLAARLTGEPGTRVVLRVIRFESGDTQTVRMRLQTYRWPSVGAALALDGGNAYLQLSDFDADAADDVRDALRQLRRAGMRALVLDLRGNPGGVVEEAVEVASPFLPDGTVVFRTSGRRNAANREYRTDDGGDARDMPLVVLVDEGTASAAEALAAALQDHDRAVIAGRRTFGKALVQTGFALPDGDLLMLTVARVISPSGRSIQRSYDTLSSEQYRSQAGTASSTTTMFRTAAGRPVASDGGVAPDVALEGPPRLPDLWVERVGDGSAAAIAERVAARLDTAASVRAQWLTNSESWEPAIMPELQAAGLAPAGWTQESRDFVLRRIAGRVAELRWDTLARMRLIAAHDPAVRAALALLPRAGALLAAPGDAR